MPPADTGTRAATRVLAIYNLGGRLRVPSAETYSPARHFDLGRFAGHVQATASLLPQMTAWARSDPGQLRLASGPFAVRVGRVAAALAITPRRDGLLFLDIELAGEPGAAEVAEFLYATWRWRSGLRVGDTPLLGWLTGRLDLSFGIEAYADVVLIPELLAESYHSSLRRVAALAESVANTSRIVERVAAVIDSRHAMLSASVQAYTERRDRILAGAIAIGSLLALPPTLLLAYFGTNSTNVNQHFSIFDVRHYGVAYLVAWLPFLALVGGAAVMRRRIQPRAPDWNDS